MFIFCTVFFLLDREKGLYHCTTEGGTLWLIQTGPKSRRNSFLWKFGSVFMTRIISIHVVFNIHRASIQCLIYNGNTQYMKNEPLTFRKQLGQGSFNAALKEAIKGAFLLLLKPLYLFFLKNTKNAIFLFPK